MVLSLDPELRTEEFHEIEPTLFECPCITLTLLTLLMSQMWTYPLFVPREIKGPFTDHPTDVTVSERPRSHNLVTLEFYPFQRQTLDANPTAKKFCCDQSIRFKQKSSCNAGASRTLKGILLIFLLLLIDVTSQSVKSNPLKDSLKGVLSLLLLVNLNKLLFWKNSMGLSNLIDFLGSFMMHFLQMSDSDSEQGSIGAGGVFSLLTLLSYYFTINYVLSIFLVGMNRSVTIPLSLAYSSLSTSRQQSQLSMLISSLVAIVFELLMVLCDGVDD